MLNATTILALAYAKQATPAGNAMTVAQAVAAVRADIAALLGALPSGKTGIGERLERRGDRVASVIINADGSEAAA